MECGGGLALTCAACGTPHAAGEKFCGECGASLQGSGSRIQGSGGNLTTSNLTTNNLSPNNLPPRASTPKHLAAGEVDGRQSRVESSRAYTPRHLAEKILNSRSALEGERKQVTVLFADVKGSLELAEQLDPASL